MSFEIYSDYKFYFMHKDLLIITNGLSILSAVSLTSSGARWCQLRISQKEGER